jgi:hypothetical protein
MDGGLKWQPSIQITLPDEVNQKRYLGIESSLNFDHLCAYLEEDWQTQFQKKADDFYGWFNFEKWYYVNIPLFLDDQTLKIYAEENNTTFQEILDWLGSNRQTQSIAAKLSPNRHRSGTYLYPDNPELTLVLEISKSWIPIDRAVEQLYIRLIALPNISAVKTLP